MQIAGFQFLAAIAPKTSFVHQLGLANRSFPLRGVKQWSSQALGLPKIGVYALQGMLYVTDPLKSLLHPSTPKSRSYYELCWSNHSEHTPKESSCLAVRIQLAQTLAKHRSDRAPAVEHRKQGPVDRVSSIVSRDRGRECCSALQTTGTH